MTSSDDTLTLLLSILESALKAEYYKHSIPSEVDKAIHTVLDNLATADHEELKAIMSGVEGDCARVLGLYAERMASLAVRENEVLFIKRGLIALLIYSQTEDPRDVLVTLSLLNDAVVRVSESPAAIFSEVSALVGSGGILTDFLKRSVEDRSIEAMGYEVSTDGDGFIYLRNWG